ncbi:MAG: thiamine-phosphate kinase [Sporichthyaceae bacterium]
MPEEDVREPGSVGALGEFGLIAALVARLRSTEGVIVGPGDDAAVVAAPDRRVVATMDLLVADRHFRLSSASARDIGRKAAAANLADVAAMGATPTALLLGLAVPGDLEVAWALEFVDGLDEECAAAGAALVGGDVVSAPTVTLAVTALGDLEGRSPVTRAGARPGDLVALCGRLGWSAAGLDAQEQNLGTAYPRLLAAHHRPSPPYAAGPQAADLGATSMIDVSDGLLADLGHVARASGVAVDVFLGSLAPSADLLAAAPALGADPATWVLTGGEDHALVATFPPGTDLPASWRRIGRVGAGSPRVTVDGGPWGGPGGWDHYAAGRS